MNHDLLISIGKRISEIRRSHNVTQEFLAEQLDVTAQHISHTERGESSLSLKNLIQFCSLYNCSLDYVVLGKSNDSVLKKIPVEISNILYSNDIQDIERLNRYLEIYVDLLKGRD